MVVISTVLAGCVLLFVVQSIVSPKLILGTLSEAVLQPCIEGKQWVTYDCLKNSITGIGCAIPGSQSEGGFITSKTIAIRNPTCAPRSDGTVGGDRVVSFQWQQDGEAGKCSSTGTSPPCCNYNGSCTSTVKFICVRTSEPENGENQCTPQFLPIHDVPGYDSTHIIPVTQEVPCRMNFCGTTP